MEELDCERNALSRHVPPDLYMGLWKKRNEFLGEVRQVCIASYLQAAPFTYGHALYVGLARMNRDRCPRLPAPPASPAPAPVDDGLKQFTKDTVTARAALRSVWSAGIAYLENDLLQEARCKLLGHEGTKEPLRKKIAHDAIVDYLRRENRAERDREYPDTDDDETEAPATERNPRSTSPGTMGRDAALFDAMKALPPRQYEAIELKFYAGCSCAEIADRMKTTHRAVEGLLSRAYVSLEELLNTSV